MQPSRSQQLDLFGPRPGQLRPTAPLRKHPRHPGLLRRVETCLALFPELDDTTITVGITRAADGLAIFETFTVRFDLRRRLPTHYVVAHELTHLLQALSLIPGGEVQCDIWTLARHPLFLDEVPCYLPLPKKLHANWPRHAQNVAHWCRQAIEVRPSHRTYIRWLGARLNELAAGV